MEEVLEPPPESSPKRSLFQRIFLSPHDARLRTGWRLLGQTILANLLSLLFLLPYPVLILLGIQLNEFWYNLAIQAASFIGITLSIVIARRFFDKRTFASLGLTLDKFAILDMLVGFAIPGAMMGVVFLVEWAAGWLFFESFAWQIDQGSQVFGGVVGMLLVFLLVGWQEELLSRGYHLQNLAEGLNMTWAVVLSSGVFSLLHWLNPFASLASTIGIFCAGFFLAFAYLRTRRLWLPIGLHIGWNFFEAAYGYPVSGMQFFSLVRTSITGPELWTGGPFGPEAGLVLLPALLLGGVLVYFYTSHNSRNRSLKAEL